MCTLSPDQLSVALFQAFARGEASPSALSSALVSELSSHCPVCRAALHAFLGEEKKAASRGGRVLPFRHQVATTEETFPFPDLDRLSREEQRLRVQRSRKRYSGNAAARAFLCRARQALPGSPAASRHWAELAQTALLNSPAQSTEDFLESATLEARSWGFVANAERVAGNLLEAEMVFERVAQVIQAFAVVDLGTLAEIHSFRGSLRRAQRRWAEAESDLVLASELHGVVGNAQGKFSARLKRALLFYLAGDPETTFVELSELWPQAEEPQQKLEVRHNQVLALLECGEATSAAMLLDESLPLYDQFPDNWTQSRLAYINGRILHALEVREPAERNYRRARAGFLSLGEPYTAAMISLDLAVLLLEANRYPEVAELALDMLATFQKVGVHREALAAWQLFVDAAHRQEASVVLAKRLGRFLENARQDPSLQFAAE